MKKKLKHMHGCYGVRIPLAVCILPIYHPCYGCVWYVRDTDVLFCPFHNCIRYKKGFEVKKEKENKNAD